VGSRTNFNAKNCTILANGLPLDNGLGPGDTAVNIQWLSERKNNVRTATGHTVSATLNDNSATVTIVSRHSAVIKNNIQVLERLGTPFVLSIQIDDGTKYTEAECEIQDRADFAYGANPGTLDFMLYCPNLQVEYGPGIPELPLNIPPIPA
jgi:hypothetical protein